LHLDTSLIIILKVLNPFTGVWDQISFVKNKDNFLIILLNNVFNVLAPATDWISGIYDLNDNIREINNLLDLSPLPLLGDLCNSDVLGTFWVNNLFSFLELFLGKPTCLLVVVYFLLVHYSTFDLLVEVDCAVLDCFLVRFFLRLDHLVLSLHFIDEHFLVWE